MELKNLSVDSLNLKKNFSAIKGRSQSAGYKAEYNVIKLLESHFWKLQFHRLKTEVAEVDLIFEKENNVILLEVKTLNNDWRAFDRINPAQLKRLRSNLFYFRKKFPKIVFRAYVVWVSPENKMSFVEII